MLKTRYTKVGVGRLCNLFGKTRQSYYDKTWHCEERLEAEFLVIEMVKEIRREMPKIGANKLHHMLESTFRSQEIKVGRDRLFSILRENKLIVKPKKKYVVTTNSKHWLKKYPNLIKEFIPMESEQLWVADITYIQIKDCFNFLSLITDAYSKQIVGYCLYPTLESKGCINALRMALVHRNKNTILYHHSDRGTQYCSAEYVGILQSKEILISMTENGDPYENAIAERINGILKYEFDLNMVFQNRNQALIAVDKAINTYNQKRPHMSCDYLTPKEAHTKTGEFKKHWKPKLSRFGYNLEKGFHKQIHETPIPSIQNRNSKTISV